MKKKYLFGMLLGGTMLVACSTDELDIAQVAQETNPSAPVFNLSFDDDFVTRAAWSGNDLGFKKGEDLLSLYHGIDAKSSSWSWNYGNAIYEVTATGESGLTLETQAYVDEGVAIMVYPASLTDLNRKGKAPVVTISLEQDEKTSLMTPYISEFMEIKKYSEKGENNTAGYGRNYDIRLRRLGTTVKFTFKEDAATKPDFSGYDIPEMEPSKVSLHSTTKNAFTKEIALAKGDAAVASSKKYPHWTASSDVDLTSAEGDYAIYTEDVDLKNNVATFTMLPGSVEELKECSFVVHTNYGTVTLTDESGEVIKNPVFGSKKEQYKEYQKKGTKDWTYFTVTEALNFLNKFLWAASEGETFKGENVGRALPFEEVKVDLSKVEMDGMHIPNEDRLNIALDVYKALKKTEPVQFILDGDENNGKKFVMSEATWDRVVTIMNDEKSNITFSACNDEAECIAIVLKSDEGVVPAMKFNTTSTDDKKVKSSVNVELAGTWTFSEEVTQTKALTLDQVDTLIVQKGAELNLNGMVINVENNLEERNFTVVNNGTVNIEKTVYLMNQMANNGKIKIPAGENRFNMYDNGQLTNNEAQGEDATGWWTPEDEYLGEAGGVIDNAGTLAIVQGATNASITNLGTINIMNGDARTLITANAVEGADIKKGYSNKDDDKNVFGTINLKTKDAGKNKLSIAEEQTQVGFIKYVAETGSDCNLANYAVVTGTTWPSDLTNKTYVEIKNNGKELDTPATLSVEALIVPEDKSLFIAGNSVVTVSEYLYLKGSITRAGGLQTNANGNTTYNFEGYFGGDKTKDKDNIFSMGNK